MSNTVIQDSASDNRQRLIRSASLEGHSLIATMRIRTSFVLKDIQRGLITVSHSKTKLMTSLTAAAVLGFAISAGAFNLKNADNELAVLQESTLMAMPVKATKDSYAYQLTSMFTRSQHLLKSAENRLDIARKSDPKLFEKCLVDDISTKECKVMKKVISTAQTELTTAAKLITTGNDSAESAVKLGESFPFDMYLASEEAFQYLRHINTKFGPNLFHGKTFKDANPSHDFDG